MSQRKNPMTRMFWNDLIGSQDYRALSPEAQALWCPWCLALIAMDEEVGRGDLKVSGKAVSLSDRDSLVRLSRWVGWPIKMVEEALTEIVEFGVASTRQRTGVIYCRRISERAALSEKRRSAGSRGGRTTAGKNAKKADLLEQNDEQTSSNAPDTSNTSIPHTPPYGVADAVKDWNELATKVGLAKCKAISARRRRSIQARLKAFGEKGWKQALAAIEASPFYRGQNDTKWRPSIDYVARDSGFEKLIERAPDNAGGGSGSLSDESWRIVMRRYQQNGDWSADGAAPDDTHGRCLVPENILEEFGFGAAGSQLPLVGTA